MDLRDKDIQFLLDVDVHTDSEASFCGSDDELASDDENITIGKSNQDELLKELAEMEVFQQEINRQLLQVDEQSITTPVFNDTQPNSSTEQVLASPPNSVEKIVQAQKRSVSRTTR